MQSEYHLLFSLWIISHVFLFQNHVRYKKFQSLRSAPHLVGVLFWACVMLYIDLPQSVRITDFYKAGVTTHCRQPDADVAVENNTLDLAVLSVVVCPSVGWFGWYQVYSNVINWWVWSGGMGMVTTPMPLTQFVTDMSSQPHWLCCVYLVPHLQKRLFVSL